MTKQADTVEVPGIHRVHRIDYDVAVNAMDDDIRKRLHDDLAPCSAQKFVDAYAEAHEEEFGEKWTPVN